jgi:acyl-CoA thioesterase YciA
LFQAFDLLSGETRGANLCAAIGTLSDPMEMRGPPTMNDQPRERYLAIRVVMMPRDTNPYGTIFGGVILSSIDLAGAVGAQHEIRRAGWTDRPMVSVAMKSVQFQRPVFVGDVVSFWTRVLRIGRTSMTMHVAVEADRQGTAVQLTEAEVTYVAMDLSGGERRPVPIRDI